MSTCVSLSPNVAAGASELFCYGTAVIVEYEGDFLSEGVLIVVWFSHSNHDNLGLPADLMKPLVDGIKVVYSPHWTQGKTTGAVDAKRIGFVDVSK